MSEEPEQPRTGRTAEPPESRRPGGVEQAVSASAAQGERTLVLYTGGPTGKGARKMLPKLPEVCFVAVGDSTGAALRRAVEHGIPQVIFVGTADDLTGLAAGALVSTEPLGEITAEMGGSPELAAEVGAAGTVRHAYELWEAAGLLGPCGRELCRRAAGVLERFAAGETAADPALAAAPGGPLAVQVVLVDFTGGRMVGMYGRLAR
ncbi:hypothetical protein DPM19_28045 [Actinomadura craniellae]|uniref:Cobalt-precorrin-5B (C(1))-methyltransferase n=1 Tax=Actinomadura craniellae TaxID=2231787 RepID=A0A365GYE4_9ACTN|nr:cobalt-precorrin-5B (C(1))-methyltransferase [Actinomadura craniellae]RAY11832.1 hypothetical protein DPM19_28045 [Actinomadura craniellae]